MRILGTCNCLLYYDDSESDCSIDSDNCLFALLFSLLCLFLSIPSLLVFVVVGPPEMAGYKTYLQTVSSVYILPIRHDVSLATTEIEATTQVVIHNVRKVLCSANICLSDTFNSILWMTVTGAATRCDTAILSIFITFSITALCGNVADNLQKNGVEQK